MTIQTLYTAATGMQAMQTKLDTVANNLANANTTAFKRDRANFEDLFYRYVKLPGSEDAGGNLTPKGVFTGLGTLVSCVQSDFRQGAFDTTGKQLDIAIEGDGFFVVTDPGSGEFLYTRSGNFSLNANGDLVMSSAGVGRLLDPPITIPPEATSILISPQGVVEVQSQGQTTFQQVGTLELARFPNAGGLMKRGENLYSETISSGTAVTGVPGGPDGIGFLRQGMLELSNVEPVRELIDLITTQRTFELNSQAIQAGDQMLQLVTNLRRF